MSRTEYPTRTEQWCTFGPLRVGFDDSVLRPRTWTLAQSGRAAALLRTSAPGPILELHCGAGHIGQAAAAWSGRAVVQIDDRPAACTWARRNATANGVDAEVRQRAVEELDEAGTFALVLADPPYVPSAETVRFGDDPAHAIDGGPDGLDGIRACLPPAARAVRPGGAVVLQVRGPAQADAVRRCLGVLEPGLVATSTLVFAPDRALLALTRSA